MGKTEHLFTLAFCTPICTPNRKMPLDVYAHVIEHQQDKAVAALEEYMKE